MVCYCFPKKETPYTQHCCASWSIYNKEVELNDSVFSAQKPYWLATLVSCWKSVWHGRKVCKKSAFPKVGIKIPIWISMEIPSMSLLLRAQFQTFSNEWMWHTCYFHTKAEMFSSPYAGDCVTFTNWLSSAILFSCSRCNRTLFYLSSLDLWEDCTETFIWRISWKIRGQFTLKWANTMMDAICLCNSSNPSWHSSDQLKSAYSWVLLGPVLLSLQSVEETSSYSLHYWERNHTRWHLLVVQSC